MYCFGIAYVQQKYLISKQYLTFPLFPFLYLKVAEERMSHIRTVRAFSQEPKEIGAYKSSMEKLLKLQYKEALAEGCFWGLVSQAIAEGCFWGLVSQAMAEGCFWGRRRVSQALAEGCFSRLYKSGYSSGLLLGTGKSGDS